MDLNATVAWIKSNPIAMLLIGVATAHRRLVFRYAILGVLKTALGRRVLLGNADEVLADFDDFRAELVEDLAEAKAADAKKALESSQAHEAVQDAAKAPVAAATVFRNPRRDKALPRGLFVERPGSVMR